MERNVGRLGGVRGEELEAIREGLAAYERGGYFTNDEVKARMGW